MSQKKLDTIAIMNELKGQSVFFQPQKPKRQEVAAPPEQRSVPKEDDNQTKVDTNLDTTVPRNLDTVTPRYHDTTIEEIRRAVREFGKEAATHRFTEAEKEVIADIVFKYKKLGIKTSENEIARIAINFVSKDYTANGRESLLDKVLKALNE